MKTRLILLCLLSFTLSTVAQVKNYALELTAGDYVEMALPIEELGLADEYTVQFWMNPTEWVKGASVVARGVGNERFAFVLGNSVGEMTLQVGSASISFNHVDIALNQWTQVTLVMSASGTQVRVNDKEVISNSSTQLRIPASKALMTIGESFVGRLDEVRLWNTAINKDFHLWRNTLNKYHPNWNNLVFYYKMDQDLCPNIVDYTFKYHGVFKGGAKRSMVADNANFKYRIQSAYTDYSRFSDRAIPREQYLFSNDIVLLGIQSFSDGSIKIPFPNNHGTVMNANYVDAHEGRTGLLDFAGKGASMNVGPKAMMPSEDRYSFQTWVYLDKWTEGAYLFKKEASNTQGFSIRLGAAADSTIIVRINGVDFERMVSNIRVPQKVGKWWHFALTANALTFGKAKAYTFFYNGKGYNVSNSNVPSANVTTLMPKGVENTDALVGVDLDGMLDETALWNGTLTEANIQGYMNELPELNFNSRLDYPSQTSKFDSYWNYDNEDRVGYDRYSHEQFIGVIRSAFDGYRGYTVRMSVKGHDGWQNTFADPAKRSKAARAIAEVAKDPFLDGIDIDFEWCYDGTCFDNYGKLIKEIADNMPENKIFTVSPHYVSYSTPMHYQEGVDYFFFQIYGPGQKLFNMKTYNEAYNNFINHGYPKDKIILSYATTTSRGSTNQDPNGSGNTSAAPIGVRNGLLDGAAYTPDQDIVWDGNHYRFFTGPEQTRERSEFCHDNDLAGIMYWDMGNDVPPAHKYNIAKWANYAISCNVDTLVTEVKLTPSSIGGATTEKNPLTIYPNPAREELNVQLNTSANVNQVNIFNVSGQKVLEQIVSNMSTVVDIRSLCKGYYVLQVTCDERENYFQSFMVN